MRKLGWFIKGCVVGWLFCLAACGAASPPLGIPAPVSNLMSLDGPDVNGTVSLIGAPGAVLPDAVVTGTNISLSGKVRRWEILFYGTAWAQQAPSVQRAVVAATDGSFRMRIFGKAGDVIRVVQTLDGETSPGTDLIVPDSPAGLPPPGGTFP